MKQSSPVQAGVAAQIRRIEPKDLASTLQLTQLIPEAPSWSLEDFRRLVSSNVAIDDLSLTRIAWVAELGSHVMGLTVVQCLRFPSDPSLAAECELESILVHPGSRRHGLGQRLLGTAITWCSLQRASVLRLEVRESNLAAIRLYENNGFARTGKRPGYYDHPQEAALLMQRMLAIS